MAGWIGLGIVVLGAVILHRLTRGETRRRQLSWWTAWAVASIALLWLTAGAYELRKTVALCVMPLGLVWIALGTWALLLLWRGKRRDGFAATVLWIALGLVGNLPLGCTLLGFLERPFVAIRPLEAGPFDAIAVLGGGVGRRPGGRAEVGSAGDRLALAAEMALAGRARLLVLTGPVRTLPDGTRVDDTALEADLLERLGIPNDRLMKVPGPRTTSEEIAVLSSLATTKGWARIGLITSAWHMRRAMTLCKRDGLNAKPLPADFRGRLTHVGIRNLIPQADGISAVQHAAWEILGTWLAHARAPRSPSP
ncbi:MAG: YdcF family protein [Acidobacteria bacterium]|nr:YdcF family protein [Acidobacteriota bacterium]